MLLDDLCFVDVLALIQPDGCRSLFSILVQPRKVRTVIMTEKEKFGKK